MENEIVSQQSNTIAQVEQSKAIQEIKAELQMAKMFPRNELEVAQKISVACQRFSLASVSMYSFPKGGMTVTGPSIRLAETLARIYGNITYGFKELESHSGRSIIQVLAWCKESNVRVVREFMIEHKIRTKNGEKLLTDPRDIYEHVASQAQRKVRAVILEVIPAEFVEDAVEQCKQTLKKGMSEGPLIDRVKKMVIAFSSLGVTEEMLSKRLNHSVDICTLDEVVELQKIYVSLKDNATKRQDWFEVKGSQDSNKTSDLNDKI